MEIISSRENRIIKYCVKLASDKEFRLMEKKVFVEGFRLSYDAYKSGVAMEHLLVTQEAIDKWPEQMAEMMDSVKYVVIVDGNIAKYITHTKTAQGVFAICEIPTFQETVTNMGKYLLLDTIQDPGNMGTIIRCSEAFGITQIVLSKGCVDIWSPKVIRSSMGSAFRQNVMIVEDMPAYIHQLKQDGIPVYSAMLDDTAVIPQEMEQGEKGIAVVVGNEGNGVSEEVQASCSHKVYIPMTSRIESLNVAAATTILMWEMAGRK